MLLYDVSFLFAYYLRCDDPAAFAWGHRPGPLHSSGVEVEEKSQRGTQVCVELYDVQTVEIQEAAQPSVPSYTSGAYDCGEEAHVGKQHPLWCEESNSCA